MLDVSEHPRQKYPPKYFSATCDRNINLRAPARLSRDVYCGGAGCCCCCSWATWVCACMHRVYCIKCLLELAFFVCLRVWCIFEFMIRDAPLVIITTIIMCCRLSAAIMNHESTHQSASSALTACVMSAAVVNIYIHWAPPRSPIATACVCIVFIVLVVHLPVQQPI